MTDAARSFDEALASGDDAARRAHLMAQSALPGPRLNLRLVAEFAGAVDEMATSGDADLRWAVRENTRKARLQRWPADIERVRHLVES